MTTFMHSRYGRIPAANTHVAIETNPLDTFVNLFSVLHQEAIATNDLDYFTRIDSTLSEFTEPLSQLTAEHIEEIFNATSEISKNNVHHPGNYMGKLIEYSPLERFTALSEGYYGKHLPPNKTFIIPAGLRMKAWGFEAQGNIISLLQRPKNLSRGAQDGVHVSFSECGDFADEATGGIFINYGNYPPSFHKASRFGENARDGIFINFNRVLYAGVGAHGGTFINLGHIYMNTGGDHDYFIDTEQAKRTGANNFIPLVEHSKRRPENFNESILVAQDLESFGRDVFTQYRQAQSKLHFVETYNWNKYGQEIKSRVDSLLEVLDDN